MEKGSQYEDYHSLRSFKETHFAARNQTLSASPSVTGQDRSHQRYSGQHYIGQAVRAAIVNDQPQHYDEVRVAVNHGIEKSAVAGLRFRNPSYSAVQHVEQAGDDEERARIPKASHGQGRCRKDAHHDAKDGQDVGINLQQGQEPNNLIDNKFAALADFCTNHALKDLEFYREILLRVLSKIVQQLNSLGRSLVQVVVDLLVLCQFPQCSFPLIDLVEQLVYSLHGIADILIQRFVSVQPAQIPFSPFDSVNDLIYSRNCGVGTVVNTGVVDKLAQRSFLRVDTVYQRLGLVRRSRHGVVNLTVVYEFAQGPATLLNSAQHVVSVADGMLGRQHRTVEVVVERGVVNELADGSLTLVKLCHDAFNTVRKRSKVGDDVVNSGDNLADVGHLGGGNEDDAIFVLIRWNAGAA